MDPEEGVFFFLVQYLCVYIYIYMSLILFIRKD